MDDEISAAIVAAMRLNARRWDDPIPTIDEADRVTAELKRLLQVARSGDRAAIEDSLQRVAQIRARLAGRG